MVVIIDGQVRNSRVYVNQNGFGYIIDKISCPPPPKKKRGKKVLYLKFAHKKRFKCSGRGKILTNLSRDDVDEWIIENTKSHNHDAKENNVEVRKDRKKKNQWKRIEYFSFSSLFLSIFSCLPWCLSIDINMFYFD